MHGLHHLHHLFARKKSSSSLRRKNSESNLQTPSDQLPREVKSAQYRTPDYETALESKGSYMREYDDDDDDYDDKGENIKTFCKTLLERDQTLPQDSLFRDDLFKKTCEKIRNRNEAMIIQEITRLIVPSAQNLAIYGAKHLNRLYECVNEGWNSATREHCRSNIIKKIVDLARTMPLDLPFVTYDHESPFHRLNAVRFLKN